MSKFETGRWPAQLVEWTYAYLKSRQETVTVSELVDGAIVHFKISKEDAALLKSGSKTVTALENRIRWSLTVLTWNGYVEHAGRCAWRLTEAAAAIKAISGAEVMRAVNHTGRLIRELQAKH